MSMYLRPHDFASARCVWLSARMSAVVSISMNQSSNYEQSCPSNVRISGSMVVVRFDSICVACKCLCTPAWFCTLVPQWAGALAGVSWLGVTVYV